MELKKATRVLVSSALTAAILFGAAAPASALDGGDRGVSARAAAAGPVDDLVNGILEAVKGLLPPGVSLPDIKIPSIELPEIPGVTLPQVPGVPLPELPLTPPALPPAPVELVPDIPEIPGVVIPGLPTGGGGLP
ncbi:hypothetical protein ACWFQ8_24155 [Streptomyces sp. NPDC055254]